MPVEADDDELHSEHDTVAVGARVIELEGFCAATQPVCDGVCLALGNDLILVLWSETGVT